MQSKPRESLRLFENDLLERLSHVHPITPLLVWAPVVLLLLWRSFAVLHLTVATVIEMGSAGFLVWTFSEYVLHRYIFHFQSDSKLAKRIHFIIHGNHHTDPQDPTRLVMPPVAGIILAVILYTLFRLVLGNVLVEPFFALFLVGYLCYDYIHFAVHHFTPRTRMGKFLKQSHMMHHFVSHNARWGVSSPLWDFVFGTTGREKKPSPRHSAEA